MRLALLSVVAKVLRIRFKVNGVPHGASGVFLPRSDEAVASNARIGPSIYYLRVSILQNRARLLQRPIIQ